MERARHGGFELTHKCGTSKAVDPAHGSSGAHRSRGGSLVGPNPSNSRVSWSKYALIPDDPVRAALTAKIIADANDVLSEMTLHNGAEMWTQERWDNYRPRLARWMAIFEEHGRRHGLTAKMGYVLGTDSPSLADLVVYVLW